MLNVRVGANQIAQEGLVGASYLGKIRTLWTPQLLRYIEFDLTVDKLTSGDYTTAVNEVFNVVEMADGSIGLLPQLTTGIVIPMSKAILLANIEATKQILSVNNFPPKGIDATGFEWVDELETAQPVNVITEHN